jgi:polysaccharide biosynthesis transport protein
MELQSYIDVLWRRRWIYLATFVICLAVAVIGTWLMTPMYRATAVLRITPAATAQDGSLGWNEMQYSDRLLNTYIQILRSDQVLDELARRFNRAEAPTVEAETPANTELLQISVEDPDPRVAAEASNWLADSLIEQFRDQDQQRIVYIAPAAIPNEPASPRLPVNILIASILGLIGGAGLAFLFENLDTTLHTTRQIQRVTGMIPLGTVPVMRDRKLGEASPQKEAFRQIRTNILTRHVDKPLTTLLVTSTLPGEGKSTIVSNLAAMIGQMEQKVVVVDCDLRLPTLHTIFNLSNESGISNVLQQTATLEDVIRSGPLENVWVITSGTIPINPAELLSKYHMRHVLTQLSQQFDVVLLDSPALLAVTDAAVLASLVDSVVLVVSRTQAREEMVRAACQQLALAGARAVNLVVNRAETNSYGSYYQLQRVSE